jgi:hypothetical protein
MNTEAIERIRGYCCEVTQEQWYELVRVADEVGVKVYNSEWDRGRSIMFVILHKDNDIVKDPFNIQGYPVIPFPDFLAKMKGDDQWQPKAGEMVEVSTNGERWSQREFIAKRNAFFVCWATKESVNTYPFSHCRPLRPTITRTEAEALLNKRIID